jgi:hypothetical protein
MPITSSMQILWYPCFSSVGNEAFVQGDSDDDGEIIHFQKHRDLKRGQLYRKQTVPHRTAAASCLKEPEVACTSETFAPAIQTRSRDGVESGRRILRTLPWCERRADLVEDGEGDPQPDIDCETLDRMYRELNSGSSFRFSPSRRGTSC